VTRVRETHVPDEVYEKVRPLFTDKELADLTLAIGSSNVWNRLNIASRNVPGTYQPATQPGLGYLTGNDRPSSRIAT